MFFPITAVTLGKIDISVKAQSTLAADAVKRQLLVEVLFTFYHNLLLYCHMISYQIIEF